MSQQQLPPEVQQTLTQYQAMRESYLRLDAELKLIETELVDLDNIIQTLNTLEGDVEVYKMVGHILVKKKKEEVLKELEERKEILSIKREKSRKQLEILEKQLRELENKLREMLSKYGITVG